MIFFNKSVILLILLKWTKKHAFYSYITYLHVRIFFNLQVMKVSSCSMLNVQMDGQMLAVWSYGPLIFSYLKWAEMGGTKFPTCGREGIFFFYNFKTENDLSAHKKQTKMFALLFLVDAQQSIPEF